MNTLKGVCHLKDGEKAYCGICKEKIVDEYRVRRVPIRSIGRVGQCICLECADGRAT